MFFRLKYLCIIRMIFFTAAKVQNYYNEKVSKKREDLNNKIFTKNEIVGKGEETFTFGIRRNEKYETGIQKIK